MWDTKFNLVFLQSISINWIRLPSLCGDMLDEWVNVDSTNLDCFSNYHT